jgi:cytochrome c oxidase cbb3-type subunit 3
MADFVSDFWHWFIIVLTVGGLLAMFPLIILNRGDKPSGDPETMGHTWDDDLQEYNNPLPGWWLNMFYITLVFGFAYLLLYPGLGKWPGLLGWTSLGQYQAEREAAEQEFGPLFKKHASEDIRQLAKNEDAMRTGERLYANYCAVCHGSDARGAPGFPNLRDGEWLWGGQPEQIKTSILDGRIAAMPGWEAALGGEKGVFAVTEYVLSLSGRRHNAEAAAEGKTKFQQLCVGCHGPEGKGNQSLGAPDLTNRTWTYGGSQKTVMESIAKGRQGRMPPHRDFLGEDKVHLLAAYVYSLAAELEHD